MAYRRHRRLRPSSARPRPSPPSTISFRFPSVERLLIVFSFVWISTVLILRESCESPVKPLRTPYGYLHDGRDSDRQLSQDTGRLRTRVSSRRRWDPEPIRPPAPARAPTLPSPRGGGNRHHGRP